jgi:hypothetical protein
MLGARAAGIRFSGRKEVRKRAGGVRLGRETGWLSSRLETISVRKRQRYNGRVPWFVCSRDGW